MNNFDEFINSCVKDFNDNLSEKIKQKLIDSINKDELMQLNAEQAYLQIFANIISSTIETTNYVVFRHLKSYNQWLQEHYEMVPKE